MRGADVLTALRNINSLDAPTAIIKRLPSEEEINFYGSLGKRLSIGRSISLLSRIQYRYL